MADLPEDPIKNVRRRPGMYFGSTGPSALRALVMEVVANAIDEVLADRADELEVTIHADRSVTIVDNGPGMGVGSGSDPAAFARLALTNFHDAPTADGHDPHVHLAFGTGLGPVCAVCERIDIRTSTADRIGVVSFSRGVELTSSLVANEGEPTGTCVRLWPDREIFEPLRWNVALLEEDLVTLAQLLPHLVVRFGVEAQSIGPYPDLTQLFTEVRGWKELIHEGPFLISADAGENRVRLALGWQDASWGPTVRSYCNLRATDEGGSHVEGIEEGLRQVFGGGPASPLMKGLVAVLHVLLLDPDFSGPTRGRLDSPEAVWLVADAI